MGDKITGGCLCGAIKYEISADPVFAAHCYCRDCQRATGAGHASLTAFPTAGVKIHGSPASYSKQADSGNTVTRRFCPTCGSRLFSATPFVPELTLVYAGTLDDPTRFVPMVGVYDKSRLPWDHKDPDLRCFPEMPPQG